MWQIWIVSSAGCKRPPDRCVDWETSQTSVIGQYSVKRSQYFPRPLHACPELWGLRWYEYWVAWLRLSPRWTQSIPLTVGAEQNNYVRGLWWVRMQYVCVCVCVFDAYADSRCVETSPGASVIGRFLGNAPVWPWSFLKTRDGKYHQYLAKAVIKRVMSLSR